MTSDMNAQMVRKGGTKKCETVLSKQNVVTSIEGRQWLGTFRYHETDTEKLNT